MQYIRFPKCWKNDMERLIELSIYQIEIMTSLNLMGKLKVMIGTIIMHRNFIYFFYFVKELHNFYQKIKRIQLLFIV